MNKIEKANNALKTFNNKNAFLFGNGINRTGDSNNDKYEWGNLLEDINKEFAVGEIKNIRKKEFPFAYDEVVNYCLKNLNKNEKEIKEYIQNGLKRLSPNRRYRDLINLRCDEILTTNYDYLLEKSLQDNWLRPNFEKTTERVYSLHRYYTLQNRRIWHIHGEQAMRTSILLGFRHYINYSSNVKIRAQQALKSMLDNKNDLKDSWVDLFFTHNINIVGQGMKFTEYPIWWLLAYRHYKHTTDRYINVNNKVNYIIPKFSISKNTNLSDTLRSYDVNLITVDVDDNDYNGFYKAVLNNEIR